MSAEHDPFKPVTAALPPEDTEALRSEVNRVQASGVLGEARLRRMFDYLAERSLAGQSPKEIAIAMDVFEVDGANTPVTGTGGITGTIFSPVFTSTGQTITFRAMAVDDSVAMSAYGIVYFE